MTREYSSSIFKEDIGFSMKKYTINRPMLVHSHDFVEMIYVINGNGKHIINGKEYLIERGAFFIIDVDSYHSMIYDDISYYYDFYFKKDYLQSIKPLYGNDENAYDLLCRNNKYPYLQFSAEQIDEIERIIENISEEYLGVKSCRISMLNALISVFLLKIRRSVESYPSVFTSRKASITLPRVIDYINQHFAENISLKTISTNYGYNQTYFGRLFHNTYGITFDDYLKNVRLKNAAELLNDTTLPIDTIISKSGYSNRSYFYKEFAKAYGCSPRIYRASCTQKL